MRPLLPKHALGHCDARAIYHHIHSLSPLGGSLVEPRRDEGAVEDLGGVVEWREGGGRKGGRGVCEGEGGWADRDWKQGNCRSHGFEESAMTKEKGKSHNGLSHIHAPTHHPQFKPSTTPAHTSTPAKTPRARTSWSSAWREAKAAGLVAGKSASTTRAP